jgi:tripartite-type tricarboxylate transporter receptor subunit TctC/ABC-type molybdate transport system substrate-binding protein
LSGVIRSWLIISLVAWLSGCEPDATTPADTARELRVVTSGGLSAAYDLIAPQFEAETGIRLVTERGASSGGAPDSIPERLARGESFDVIILSRSSLDRLTEAGYVRPDSRRDLGHSSIGMAVREGTSVPDIGTPEAFVDTLRAASSIGYSASASGTYLSTDLFPRIGIWQDIEAKSTRIVSERVAAVVARGDVEIGFQQVSELLPIEGARFAGRIPDEYQKITTFSTGITTTAADPDDAERLVDFLSSPRASIAIQQTGLDPVAAVAGDFPSRPVTIVVAFGVGGSADRMTRTISSFIADALGQPIQVINKRGAGTLIGSNYLLEQPHDGYTMLASGFSPYLTNTILEGNADYTIDDFAYLNFQWFDEDLIAVNRDSEYRDLPALLEAIRNHPKTVRGSVVRGSGGHLIAKLLLEVSGIPQENLNLVAYNGGGLARAAVAGHVVDFIIISAEGTESIREYVHPLAIVSEARNPEWDAPTLAEAMAPTGIEVPLLPGTIRGLATSAETKRQHPERFKVLAGAVRDALAKEELQQLLERASIGGRWTGPEESERLMRETFRIFEEYGYLLKEQ